MYVWPDSASSQILDYTHDLMKFKMFKTSLEEEGRKEGIIVAD
jgi:hypothetical protein